MISSTEPSKNIKAFYDSHLRWKLCFFSRGCEWDSDWKRKSGMNSGQHVVRETVYNEEVTGLILTTVKTSCKSVPIYYDIFIMSLKLLDGAWGRTEAWNMLQYRTAASASLLVFFQSFIFNIFSILLFCIRGFPFFSVYFYLEAFSCEIKKKKRIPTL